MFFILLLYFITMNVMFLPIYCREPQNKMNIFILCITSSSIIFLWILLFEIPSEIIAESFKQGNGYLIITYPFSN